MIIKYRGDRRNLANHPDKGSVNEIILDEDVDAAELRAFTNLSTVVSMKTPRWIPSVSYIINVETVIRDRFDSETVKCVVETLPLLEKLTFTLSCENLDLIPVSGAVASKKTLRSIQLLCPHSSPCCVIVAGIASNKNIDELRMNLSNGSTQNVQLLTNIKRLSIYAKGRHDDLVKCIIDLVKKGHLTWLSTTYMYLHQFKEIMRTSNLEYVSVIRVNPMPSREYIHRTINNRKMIMVDIAVEKFLSLRSIGHETKPIPLRNAGPNYCDIAISVY